MEQWLIELAIKGGPGALSVLTVFLIWNPKITAMSETLRKVEAGKRWVDVCQTKHVEVDRRLNHLEKKVGIG